MISSIVSRLVILVFGTLYPAYASYKAVRTKNVKEYVKWMMYWIVFALFTCAETFTDVFLSFWFPFYYEIKIILVLWLLSPATKGSSILYRKFVHPMLSRREQEIDEYIAKAKEQGYSTVLHLGTKGVNYATSVIMQTAIKNLSLPSTTSSHGMLPAPGGRMRTSSAPGDEPDYYEDDGNMKQNRRRARSVTNARIVSHEHINDMEVPSSELEDESVVTIAQEPKRTAVKRSKRTRKSPVRAPKKIDGGGGLVQQLRRSYSLSDLNTDSDIADMNRNSKTKILTNIPDEDLEETDEVSMDNHRTRRTRGYSPRRSASGSGRVEMYFPEVDVDVRQHGSHSRDPSLTLSQIRSSEDVSSGYSSAEPLYSGHHVTRNEGLTASREPLIRTASVGGASRTARTRSARGGAVPKRSSPAEDSEQWDGDMATCPPSEEQIVFQMSSSMPLPSVPLQRSLSQTEVILLLQQLNSAGISCNISNSLQDSVAASLNKEPNAEIQTLQFDLGHIESCDEKLQLDHKRSLEENNVNDFQLSLPGSDVDVITSSKHNISVTLQDQKEISNEGYFIKEDASSSLPVLDAKDRSCDSEYYPKHTTQEKSENNEVFEDAEGVLNEEMPAMIKPSNDTSLGKALLMKSEELNGIANIVNNTERNNNCESSFDVKDDSQHNPLEKNENTDIFPNVLNEEEPSKVVKDIFADKTISEKLLTEAIDELKTDIVSKAESINSDTIIDVNNYVHHSTQEKSENSDILPSVILEEDSSVTINKTSTDKMTSEKLLPKSMEELNKEVVVATEPLIFDELHGHVSDPNEIATDQVLKQCTTVENRTEVLSIELQESVNTASPSPPAGLINEGGSTEVVCESPTTKETEEGNALTDSTSQNDRHIILLDSRTTLVECTDRTETKDQDLPCNDSECEREVDFGGNAIGKETKILETNQLDPQEEETKDPQEEETKDPQEEETKDPQIERKDVRSGRYNKLQAPSPPSKESNSSSNSTNSLILNSSVQNPVSCETYKTHTMPQSPGKIEYFPKEEEKSIRSEKPISSSSGGKRKNLKKQKGSAITRLFALPSRTQLGQFASYLPFWHYTKEVSTHTSKDQSQEGEFKPSEARIVAAEHNASGHSTSPSNLLPSAPMSTCSLEYLPYVGNSEDLSAGSSLNREKSNSMSNFHIRDLSHSPPSSRRQ